MVCSLIILDKIVITKIFIFISKRNWCNHIIQEYLIKSKRKSKNVVPEWKLIRNPEILPIPNSGFGNVQFFYWCACERPVGKIFMYSIEKLLQVNLPNWYSPIRMKLNTLVKHWKIIRPCLFVSAQKAF